MVTSDLPASAWPLCKKETFTFACHPGVPCFTECCRKLDLVLTPYDVLRLKNCLGLSSQQFLESHVEMAANRNDIFPVLYLAMADDESGSCPFVEERGCSVYDHRPAPCRFYPVGRGVSRNYDDSLSERYVLLEEMHCRGFQAGRELTPESWTIDQQLQKYLRFNDQLTSIVQHANIRSGAMRPDERQQDLYILSLFNLDHFRELILEGSLPSASQPPSLPFATEVERDEAWLIFAIQWLTRQLFG